MEYISAILEHVVPIISEASKSQLGLISLIALVVLTIVLLFLYLTAQTRPVLSFVLALAAILLMFGGVVGLVLSTPDFGKPAIVYDAKRLQRLKEISFKVPNLEDKNTTDYRLLDGKLQRQPDETWQERQQHTDGLQTYDYKQTTVMEGLIQYRRPDNSVELVVHFPERLICWREIAPQTGSHEHCPYAVVSFE